MTNDRLNHCGPLLVAGINGSLGVAVARTMASTDALLGLAATHRPLSVSVYEEALLARQNAALLENVIAFSTTDLGSRREVSALLDDAEDLLSNNYAVVFCGRITTETCTGGKRTVVAQWVQNGLDAIATRDPGRRPRAVVIAARVLPPLTAEEATEAIQALVATRLGTTIPHRIVAVEDPHAAASVRAFGVMDRPFGRDFEVAQRREAAAAHSIRDFLTGMTAASMNGSANVSILGGDPNEVPLAPALPVG